MAFRRAWRTVAAVGLACTGLGVAACQPAACTPSATVVDHATDDGSAFFSSKGATNIEVPAPSGTHASLDMDGDHTADTLTFDSASSRLTVHRHDGDLVVQFPPVAGGYSISWGGADLDGDGRDELVVDVARTSSLPGSPFPITTHFVEVFAGTTPVGSIDHTSADVIDTGRVTADATGDGLRDLLISGVYVSGAQALAARSGRPPGVDRIGSRADLDGDGTTDSVHLGSPDGTVAPRIALSGGGTVAFPDAPWASSPTAARSALGSDGTRYVARTGADGTTIYRLDVCHA